MHADNKENKGKQDKSELSDIEEHAMYKREVDHIDYIDNRIDKQEGQARQKFERKALMSFTVSMRCVAAAKCFAGRASSTAKLPANGSEKFRTSPNRDHTTSATARLPPK